MKHANPCGVALGASPLEAYQRAFKTDPTSAFGGIIAFNATVDRSAAEAVSAQFLELLIAPAYTDEALELLKAKANVRVLTVPLGDVRQTDFKRVGGGPAGAERGLRPISAADLKLVTKRAPTRTGTRRPAVRLARRQVCEIERYRLLQGRHDRRRRRGPDEPRRLGPHRQDQGGKRRPSIGGCVVASDAFFPFRDGLDVLAEAGATAVIQPGGSMRDAEVIAAADEHGLAMVLTGFRHFRH